PLRGRPSPCRGGWSDSGLTCNTLPTHGRKTMTDRAVRAEATRRAWLETIERHRHDRDAPGSADYWSPRLDTASRDEIRAIQDDKIAAVAPFLYENSDFYRRRFDRLGLAPTDLRNVDDLQAKWPVVDKLEMAEDA